MFKKTTLFLLVLLFFGCASEKETKLRAFRKNNNNFPEIKRFTNMGLEWKLSNWFNYVNKTDYLYYDFQYWFLAQNHCQYTIEDLSTFFTIEKFSEKEIDDIQYLMNESSKLKSVQKYYYQKLNRKEANFNTSTIEISEPIPVKNKFGFQGKQIMYFVSKAEYGLEGAGLVSFLQRKDEIIVVQMFSSYYSIGLISDDFQKAVSSIQ